MLRVRPAEPLVAADGAGRWRPCVLGAPGSAVLEATGPVVGSAPLVAPLGVGFSLLPGDRTETVARQLTELGIDRITLLVTDRTVVRPTRALARLERLRRVVREAAMQARRPRLPEVIGPLSLDQALAASAPGTVALAEPGGGALAAETSAVLVGPEGGWSERELARAMRTIGLGDGVLRAETAPVVAGGLLVLRRAGLVDSR